MTETTIEPGTMLPPGRPAPTSRGLGEWTRLLEAARRGAVPEVGGDLWARYGWLRPRTFLAAGNAARAARAPSTHEVSPLFRGTLQSSADVQRALHRRSSYGATMDPVGAAAWRSVLRICRHAQVVEPQLLVGFVVEAVDGVRPGSYLLRRGPDRLEWRVPHVDKDRLAEVGQGQGFVKGGGATLFLGIDWTAVERAGLDPELAYHETLVAVGRVGHAVVLEVLQHGLGTRMTPALKESVAAELFHLEDTAQDMLYLLKFGHPRAKTW